MLDGGMESNIMNQPEFEVALRLLRQGSVAGVVVLTLEKSGMPAHQCREIVRSAQKVVAREERIKAFFVVCGGVFVTVLGAFLIWVVHGGPGRSLRIPILITMVGVMVLIYGLLKLFRPRPII